MNWEQGAERAETAEKSDTGHGVEARGDLAAKVLKHGETEERRLLV
jgi:hypothetical protein